jgi:outer membrane protein assembly factor BamA
MVPPTRTRRDPKTCAAACLLAFAWLLLTLLGGCAATIPATRYGVDEVAFEGVEAASESDLREALVTEERSSFLFWRWPWTDWPLYDDSAFQRDLLRVTRWYRARGYYDAKVTAYQVTPKQALTSDLVPAAAPGCEREDTDEGCRLRVLIRVDEGKPVVVRSIQVRGVESLSRDLRESLREAVVVQLGERFDENDYDRSKVILRRELANESFARAQVEGTVEIDAQARTANVTFDVRLGPSCVLGEIRLEGNGDLDANPILGASFLEQGKPFSAAEIADAQRAIFALGVFASVDVVPLIPTEDEEGNVIPVVIRVTPGRLFRAGLGGGLQIGTFEFLNTTQAVPQWDVHAVAPVIEFRNFLGGLRKLRIEERPRLIFPAVFPAVETPRLGNEVRLEFRQPAFLEPRTTLALGSRWDYGPDPNIASPAELFFRHDVNGQIGPERHFFDGRLFLALRLQANVYLPDTDKDSPSSFHTMAFEETVNVDLRDNAQSPTQGAFFGLTFMQGGFFLPSSWDFLRLAPEARGYLPLPGGVVLAARFGLGMAFILDSDSFPNECDAPGDDCPERLGPRNYRFRAGGASSNRGYLPNQVGGSERGGTREWEASIELRLRVSDVWGLVFFADAGDVDDTESATFRFSRLHLSLGGGFRFYTPVGPIRIDLGLQVPGAQVLGGADEEKSSQIFGVNAWEIPGALNITIGEAF